ncbi:MAG TPA: hypothetical protein VGI92_04160 [Gemmatimonadales bacterium]
MLATAQLVAYAAAPVLEGMTEHAVGQAAIHNGHKCSTVILHDTSTCLACQLLTIAAERPEQASLPVFSDGRATLVELAASSAPRAPPLRVHTRAPPITLG